MKKTLILLTILSCFVFSSCGGDDEPDLNFSDITLTYKQTYTIPNGKGYIWSSSAPLVASVEGNVVTATHVGEAIIRSEKGSFKVTVSPSSHLFEEPYIQWGASKQTVKASMGGKNPSEETITRLTYSSAQCVVMYNFKNGGLTSSGIGLNGDYVDSDELVTYMLERYIPVTVDEEKYSFYFASLDKKTAIMMSLEASGSKILYVIVYGPLNTSDTRTVTAGISRILGNGCVKSPLIDETFQKMKGML